MSIPDIVILVIIVGFALWGLMRGLIREAFEAAGLGLGVLLSWQLAPMLGERLPPESLPLFLRIIAASVIILLVVFLVVMILGWITRKVIRHGPVKSADRLGGLLVGALKGSLVVLAIAIIASITPLGYALERQSDDSFVLRLTMKVARPMGERYRKAVVRSIKKSVSKAIPAIVDAATKEASEAGATLKSLSLADLPSNLTIDLNNLSPATEKLLDKMLSDPSLSGLGFDMNLSDLKAAGLGTIDLSLDELTPEARKQAAKFIGEAVKDGVDLNLTDLESLVGERELEDLLKDADVQEVKQLLGQ